MIERIIRKEIESDFFKGKAIVVLSPKGSL